VIALHRGDRYRRQQLHPVTVGLSHEPFGQLRAGDAVGEARVVVYLAADAGLASERAGLHHHGVDAFPGGVDGGRQPGRPAPDDDQVVGRPGGGAGEADVAGQGLVARIHLMGPVRVDHRRDDLSAVLQLLEPLDGLRLGVDVHVGVADLVRGEELLHTLAVRAPRRPVHGHDRLVRGIDIHY